MKVSVPCPDPFSVLTCHLHNLRPLLVQHLCMCAYGHMGSFNKKGEFPTVPHHLHSPTMAAASQAMLDGPPALAVQHPHVHQKGEMNTTTTTMQPQPQPQPP